MEHKKKPAAEGGKAKELWRERVVELLLLTGAASLTTAGFFVGTAVGFLALGGVSVALAILIHASGGDGA